MTEGVRGEPEAPGALARVSRCRCQWPVEPPRRGARLGVGEVACSQAYPLIPPLHLGHALPGRAPKAVDTEASKGRSGFCGLAEHRCPVRGDLGRR